MSHCCRGGPRRPPGRPMYPRVAARQAYVSHPCGRPHGVARTILIQLYGQPREKGIDWARDPEGMRRIKESQEMNPPLAGDGRSMPVQKSGAN